MMGTRHERALLAAAFLLGALLRLPGIEEVPLGADEAAQAWSVTQAVRHGEFASTGISSAFLASAQAVLFVLVEPGTFLARLPAALCGLALLAVPILLKDSLGSVRRIALVWLLAVDPTLVSVAREASGGAAAVLAAALAAVGIVRWSRTARVDAAGSQRLAIATSAAFGILVTTGPHAWSLVLPVGLVAVTLKPWRASLPRWSPCAAAFAASALLAASAGLWVVPWAGAVSASLTTWLGWLARPTHLATLLEVVRSSPLAVLLAFVGAVVPSRGRAAVLVALGWGVLLAARSGDAAALAAALAWCASGAVDRAIADGIRATRWRVALAAGALALVVQVGSSARPLVADRATPARPDLETLAADLERIAVLKGREATELPALVLGERDEPSVRWALRRERAVRHEAHRPTWSGGRRPALILSDAERAAAPAGYVGTTYDSAAGPVRLWVPID